MSDYRGDLSRDEYRESVERLRTNMRDVLVSKQKMVVTEDGIKQMEARADHEPDVGGEDSQHETSE